MAEKLPDGRFSAKVGDSEYIFEMYDADKSWLTFCELSHCIGEGMHFMGLAKNADENELALQFAMLAAQALLRGVGKDPQRSLRLAKMLACEGVECDGQRMQPKLFSLHFKGKMTELMLVLAAALEVQYGNFFSWLKPLMPLIRQQMRPISPTTTSP